MNEAQRKYGEPLAIVRKKVRTRLTPMIQDFIRQAPFAVLATANREGDCDASPKGGRPGFAKVLDEAHLLLPDIAGNNLFQSYENLETNPRAGLLFLIPGCEWTCRVNGRVRVLDGTDEGLEGIAPDVFAEDGNTRLVQGIVIEVDEAFTHCPRAFLFSKLWDPEGIAKTAAQDPNKYWLARWRAEMEDA